MSRRFFSGSSVVLSGMLVGAIPPAFADNVVITYSPAMQTAPDFTSICANASTCDYGLENFSTWQGASAFTSYFDDAGAGTFTNAGMFGGAYAAGVGTTTGGGGAWVVMPQNQYGGVNGDNYPELYGNAAPQVSIPGTGSASYNVALTASGVPGVNYFGVWISALDGFNNLSIYDGSNLVAQFNSAILLSQLGTCAVPSANAYCGNPTTQFLGQDPAELFTYVNIFDLDGYITNVTFSNSGTTGFESTNDAVGYIDPIHTVGTVVPEESMVVPEPATSAIMGAALLALSRVRRRR